MREIFIVGYQDYSFAKSLIVGEIEFLDREIPLEGLDALIFTSKNAIRALAFLAEKYPSMRTWKQIPSLLIGASSAQELTSYGGKVEWVSSDFHSHAFIEGLIPRLQGRYALYLRAREIASRLDHHLRSQGIKIASEIIYQSKPKAITQPPPPKDSVLLFTSPSTYRYFVQSFGWDDSYLAIALGKTTLASLDDGIQKMLSPMQGIQESILHLQEVFPKANA